MTAAIGAEILKLRRSRLWWITLLAATVAVLMVSVFTFIGLDPDRARPLGLIGTKAELVGLPADWAGAFSLLAQATAVGGTLIFGLLAVWMFGREFADRTAKDLLALPTSRTAIMAAKFAVLGSWSLLLAAYMFALGLVTGAALSLPGWSAGVALNAATRHVVVAAMTVALTTVVGLAASVGRGYLAAIDVLVALLFCAQIVAALGYGRFFPWSVPALYSGLGGASPVPPGSIASVFVVAAVAVSWTVWWWRRADQTR